MKKDGVAGAAVDFSADFVASAEAPLVTLDVTVVIGKAETGGFATDDSAVDVVSLDEVVGSVPKVNGVEDEGALPNMETGTDSLTGGCSVAGACVTMLRSGACPGALASCVGSGTEATGVEVVGGTKENFGGAID